MTNDLTDADEATAADRTGARASAGPGVASPPSRSAAGRAAVVVLAVLTVLLVVASLLLAWNIKSDSDKNRAADDARSQAVIAARQTVLNLDSLSSQTIDRDLQRVVAASTGTFKVEFSKAQADLKKLIVDRGTVSTGQIRSAGLVRSDSDTATVLVAVDRTIKDKSAAQAAVARDRWRVDLELHGGRWLVADLQPVS